MSCPDGRWGRRRVRDTECEYMIRAEDVYTQLLVQRQMLKPGWTASLALTCPGGRNVTFWTEVVANAVWRCGRVFLRCPWCGGRCTRLYQPTSDAEIACRTCWGLTCESRTRRNYKDRSPCGPFGWFMTHRSLAYSEAEFARQKRRTAAGERATERRALRTPSDDS